MIINSVEATGYEKLGKSGLYAVNCICEKGDSY